jgi:beta-fructofuranosidase
MSFPTFEPTIGDVAARIRSRSADPQRPRYHFLAPHGWLNDPNGLIQWNGQYHMFYQYNPNGPFHGTIHWGHAVSGDLVHWEDLPIALAPTPGGPDADGCWSGCAVDHDGVPTLIYTGVRGRQQHACLATSDDGLQSWQKYPGNPIITPPPGLDLVGFRDHSVWREPDAWYQLIGAGIAGVGGTALLYRSRNMIDWEYLHPLCIGDVARTRPLWTGAMWECPDFFRLGNVYVLVISAHDQHGTHYPLYFTGRYADQRFVPERELRFELGSSFYAPQSTTDAQGRRLMWGWLREGRSSAAQLAAGWSGVMSLPRVLAPRPDKLIGITPAPELQRLRGAHTRLAPQAIGNDVIALPSTLAGDGAEIIAEWAPGDAREFGLKVRCSPDGTEETVIRYDRARGRLLIDRTYSSLNDQTLHDVRGGTFALVEDEPLILQIFLDRSTIEIFANGRITLCERIYPTRADSLNLAAFASGGTATLTRLDHWPLGAIWPS